MRGQAQVAGTNGSSSTEILETIGRLDHTLRKAHQHTSLGAGRHEPRGRQQAASGGCPRHEEAGQQGRRLRRQEERRGHQTTSRDAKNQGKAAAALRLPPFLSRLLSPPSSLLSPLSSLLSPLSPHTFLSSSAQLNVSRAVAESIELSFQRDECHGPVCRTWRTRRRSWGKPRSRQGLTLVHFSAQLEQCLTQENTLHTLNTPYHPVNKGYTTPTQTPTQSAQVELKSGRV